MRQREGLALSLARATLPCANTCRYVCDHIDPDELNETLDGKSLRGTAGRKTSDHQAVQLLGLYHVTT